MIIEASCPHCGKRGVFVAGGFPSPTVTLPWKAKSLSCSQLADCPHCGLPFFVKLKVEVKP